MVYEDDLEDAIKSAIRKNVTIKQFLIDCSTTWQTILNEERDFVGREFDKIIKQVQ